MRRVKGLRTGQRLPVGGSGPAYALAVPGVCWSNAPRPQPKLWHGHPGHGHQGLDARGPFGCSCRGQRRWPYTGRKMFAKDKNFRPWDGGPSSDALAGHRSNHFHSQSLVWVFPSTSTSYSNTLATAFSRARLGVAVVK